MPALVKAYFLPSRLSLASIISLALNKLHEIFSIFSFPRLRLQVVKNLPLETKPESVKPVVLMIYSITLVGCRIHGKRRRQSEKN